MASPPWLTTEPPSLETLIDDFAAFAFATCVVVDRRGHQVPFVENAMQRRVNQIEDEERRSKGHAWLYQLKMRRGGLSMNTQLRNLWRIWRKPDVRGITLAHEDESTNELFQITRGAVLRFPPDLLPVMSRERQRAVTFPEMGCRFLTGTAGTTGLGRGSDYSFLHVSEFAFVKKPKELHTSASQALRADGTYIAETTASSYGSEAHVIWQEARAGRSKFRAVFFPWWWRDDAYLPLLDPDELDPLDAEEVDLQPALLRFHLEELPALYGSAPDLLGARRLALMQLKWRRDKILEIGKHDFDREYPKDDTSCWLLAGTPYFSGAALRAAREQHVRDPIRREWNGALRIYAEPDPAKRYLIGVDPAEGVDDDRSAFTVLEYETWAQVAAFSSRVCPPEELAATAAAIGRRYRNARTGEAVIVPERNSAGHTTVTELKRLRYPLSRVWHDTKMVEGKRSTTLGWRTTEETKHIALDEGAALIRENLPILRDQETVEDLLAVQRGKTGKVELTGKDCAMAWLLAYQGRKHPVASLEAWGDAASDEVSEAVAVTQRSH